MQTRQAKKHNPDPATKTLGPAQKAVRAAAPAKQQPAWTSAWGEHLPSGLVNPLADLQAQHIVSQPGDPYEREADQVADQVMRPAALESRETSIPPSSPGSPTTPSQLASTISRAPSMIQRADAGEGVDSAETTAENAPTTTGFTPALDAESAAGIVSPGEASTAALIVDDAADQLGPGQMKKSDFLAQLKSAVCTTTGQALAGTIWSAAGCPWVEHWFGYYANRDSQQIERALRRYAPETARASSASDYIPIICERVRRAVSTWATTGEVTGVPEGMSVDIPGETSMEEATPSAETKTPSSSPGTVSFKGRDGGAREPAHPQTIQSQLGTGRSLDSGIRSNMESAFGVDFSHVQVHTNAQAAGLSESLNARAFTVGKHIAFGSGEYQPGSLIGDALIAHELAHVIQQGNGGSPAVPMQRGETVYNDLEEDADSSAIEAVTSLWGMKGMFTSIAHNALPRLKVGLRLQRCTRRRSLRRAVDPGTVKFSDVQRAWQTLTTQPEKNALLDRGVDSARRRAHELYLNSSIDPIKSIRDRIVSEAGVFPIPLEPNPFIAVSQDEVEQAYRAWAAGAGEEPWVLLALWKKEGLGRVVPDTIATSTPDNAKSLYRSNIYYGQMGMDFLTDHSYDPVYQDNLVSNDPAANETVFRRAVAAQVSAHRLASDISNDINAELTATLVSPGHYRVAATSRFYILSLTLAGAYYRENEAVVAANPLIGANPDPGLVYMRWNMQQPSFSLFVTSAEAHRMESAYNMPGGRHPSITQWAFERHPAETEYGQVRRNAIRFRYFMEVFRLAYEGW